MQKKIDLNQAKPSKSSVRIVPNPLMSTMKSQGSKQKVWMKTNLYHEQIPKAVQVNVKVNQPAKQQPQKENSHQQLKVQEKIEQIQVKQKLMEEQAQLIATKSKIFVIQEIKIVETDHQVEYKIPEKKNVSIDVVQSIQKGSALSKYMVYKIIGYDKLGKFELYRKYAQFKSLRNILYKRWPGCFIPSVRSKSQIKKQEQKQRHIRVILSNFLIGLSYSDHLYYREQVQLFLRSPDIEIGQMVERMPVLKTRDVINRFKSFFGQQIEGNSEPNNAIVISGFTTFLQKIVTHLNSLVVKVLALSESYDNYVQRVSKFAECSQLYEKLSLSEFTNNEIEKTIFMKDADHKIQKLSQIVKTNPFYKLYCFLNNETHDVQAFLEVITASEVFTVRRDELAAEIKDIQSSITQISLGHKTIKTMTTRKPTEEVLEQLKEKLKKWNQEKCTIVEMVNILQIILAKKQIDLFKKFKCDNYRLILKQWTKLTGQQLTQLSAIWEFVRKNSIQLMK